MSALSAEQISDRLADTSSGSSNNRYLTVQKSLGDGIISVLHRSLIMNQSMEPNGHPSWRFTSFLRASCRDTNRTPQNGFGPDLNPSK